MQTALGSYAYLRKILYNACSVAVLSARMLQAMLCSHGSRKLIFLVLWHWFLFPISLGVSVLALQLVPPLKLKTLSLSTLL